MIIDLDDSWASFLLEIQEVILLRTNWNKKNEVLTEKAMMKTQYKLVRFELLKILRAPQPRKSPIFLLPLKKKPP